jgi:hypothetical protein
MWHRRSRRRGLCAPTGNREHRFGGGHDRGQRGVEYGHQLGDVNVNQPRAADTTTEVLAALVKDWMDANAGDMVADWCGDNHDVEDWLNENAHMTIEHWMNYNAQPKMGEAIEEALEELDLEGKIEEVIGSTDWADQLETAINDMDLVVRTR